jgi:hypothetical protein
LAIIFTIQISSALPESRIEGGFLTLVPYIFRRRSLGQHMELDLFQYL